MTIIDRRAPGVRISVLPSERSSAGEPLDLQNRILAFSYEDSEQKADRMIVQLDNQDLSLFSRAELMGGALLEVSWGYPGAMAPSRRVVIKKFRGFTTLNLEGLALAVLLRREAKTRQWEHTTRSEVVRSIAAEYGYSGPFLELEDTAEVLDLQQTAESDAHFLRRLAVKEGFLFYIDDSGLHFHPRRQHQAPQHLFVWYAGQANVLSVSVESDLLQRAGKVVVKGRNPLTRTTIVASASSATTARTTLGETLEVVDPETGTTSLQQRNATAIVRPSAVSREKSIQQEADTRFRTAERTTIKLSMQVVGDPTLRAKSLVEVRGISPLLSGLYYVTEVKHQISGAGYVCDLALTRDGLGTQPTSNVAPQGGQRNRSVPVASQVREVEIVDPETGTTKLEYRN